MLIDILKWVVTIDLDLRSLENCAEVCRGFYVAARSADIWRLVCLRTWGLNTAPIELQPALEPESETADTVNYNGNVWRNYYLSRPRVQLNGCYIARMSYFRQGERRFQVSLRLMSGNRYFKE